MLLNRWVVSLLRIPAKFEEILDASLDACPSPNDESTILCLNCKKDLLIGLDHITD